MNSRKQISLVIGGLGAALTAVSLSGAVRADSTAPADGDAILHQAALKLASAKSLSADFEEIDAYPGKYRDLAQRGTLTVARPGLLRIDIRRFRRVDASDPWTPSGNDTTAVSDGKIYWYAFLHPHSTQTRQSEVTPGVLRKALTVDPAVRGYFSPNPETAIAYEAGTATLLPTATWEGATYTVVQYSVPSRRGEGASASTATSAAPTVATAYVGQDQLIHHLVYSTQTPRGTATKEWNLRNVRLDQPVSAATFAFVPPADATDLAEASGEQPLEAGTVAPNFTVTDPSGKQVQLSDYRGKTVVLDFWATWCWPCNQSLPHSQEIVQRYRSKDVVALAVAIRDSKAGFDAWLPKHHYPDLKFVYDAENPGATAAASLYHVETTPTAYVVDPEGRIVRSIVGFSGPNDELASAIDAAQAGAKTTASAK